MINSKLLRKSRIISFNNYDDTIVDLFRVFDPVTTTIYIKLDKDTLVDKFSNVIFIGRGLPIEKEIISV